MTDIYKNINIKTYIRIFKRESPGTNWKKALSQSANLSVGLGAFSFWLRNKGGENMERLRPIKEKITHALFAVAAAVSLNFLVIKNNIAFAADDAWKKAGITPDGNIKNSSVYQDLDNLVYFVMAVGGFWVVICLLFAGMRLSAAQTNPQARTQGFIGLAMACIGLFIIVKAYDIAGWIAGFGS